MYTTRLSACTPATHPIVYISLQPKNFHLASLRPSAYETHAAPTIASNALLCVSTVAATLGSPLHTNPN